MSAVAEPRRARTGLGLVLVAIVVGVGMYVAAGFGKRDKIPAHADLYVPMIAVGFLVAWFLTRKVARAADPALLPIGAILAGIGFAAIYRLSGGLAAEQATWLMVGLGAYALTLLLVRDDRQLDGFTYTIGLVGLVLLLLPIVPGLGATINGARLWVRLGPLSFQPSEFGKVLVVIFLASYLSEKRELLAQGVGSHGLPRVKDLGPVLLAWGASLAVLFLEKDLGASLLYFAVFVVMLWVATGRWSYLAVGLVLFVAGAGLGYLAFAHVQLRVAYWQIGRASCRERV